MDFDALQSINMNYNRLQTLSNERNREVNNAARTVDEKRGILVIICDFTTNRLLFNGKQRKLSIIRARCGFAL